MIDPKIVLPTSDMPRQWYNLAADLPSPPPPPLGPDGRPIGPEMLSPVFPMNLIEQEMCGDRWVDIPEGILDNYPLPPEVMERSLAVLAGFPKPE